jgi:hypothetical protein
VRTTDTGAAKRPRFRAFALSRDQDLHSEILVLRTTTANPPAAFLTNEQVESKTKE